MYICGMFIRKNKNMSGTTSVVVIDKSGGRFCELKAIGVSFDEQEIDERGEMLYPCRCWLMKTNYINGKEVDNYNLHIEKS